MRARPLLGVMMTGVLALGLVGIAAPAGAATYELELSGANEIPGPGDPDGSGVARVRINVRAQRVCYAVAVMDIDLPAIGAHIHRGREGVAGPVKVTLNNPTEVGSTGIGLAFGCEREVPRKLLRRIRSNPERFYVNIHTEAFPDGAVRDQLA
jgi:hypothetical protein